MKFFAFFRSLTFLVLFLFSLTGCKKSPHRIFTVGTSERGNSCNRKLFPTLMDAAGASNPVMEQLDGNSLMSYIKEQKVARELISP